MLIQNVTNTPTAGRNVAEVSPSAAPVSGAQINNIPTSAPVATVANLHQAHPISGLPEDGTQLSPTQLKSVVDKINVAMKELNSNLQFSIDQDTQRVVVKVVEAQTGQVIKQFPSAEMLALAKSIGSSMPQGLLVKQNA